MSDVVDTVDLQKEVKRQKRVISVLTELVETIRVHGLPHHMLEGSYEQNLTSELARLRLITEGLRSELCKLIRERDASGDPEDVWTFGHKRKGTESHETK